MQLITRLARRLDARREDGFTMVLAIAALFLVTAMSVAAYAAVQGDQPLTRNDNLQKQAYAAAQAGIQQYLFDLDANNQYWTQCAPAGNTSGLNLMGSTANRRQVAGSSTEWYAIELIPANGQAQCSTSDPTGTMISSSGTNAGSLEIRSTGFAGNPQSTMVKRTIVAQLRENTFLDYVWFTKYETDDPAVQLVGDGCSPSSCPYSSWSTALTAAQNQCGLFYRNSRTSNYFYTDSKSNHYFCDQLYFISGDNLQGPVYTDDEFAVCGSPAFGRSSSDAIMIGAPSPGQSTQNAAGCASTPVNDGVTNGPVTNNAPIIDPPSTNSALQTLAASNGLLLTGPNCITFGNGTISVVQPTSGTTCQTTTATAKTYPYPANGVIYVQNSPTLPCTIAYNYTSPDYTTDASTSGCGIAYVQGPYNKPVTVGTANDLVVTGNLSHNGATSLLGLVANGYVRVQHTCTSGIQNLTIEGAILSVQHSFLVDNYKCGGTNGTLTVLGSIAQEFRGSVGMSQNGTLSSGYTKNYSYDNRLMYEEPPYFLDPVVAAWRAVRENECSVTASNSC